jgi:2-phosphosulfolactate phosphatase
MKWHIVEGAEGCTFAVEHGYVAVVADALRASATAAMLLDAGAVEIVVVREVEEAFEARQAFPDALLLGERGGLPPAGFDFGNSPRTVAAARGKRVIFTTTTGAQRLVDSWGARAVYMGTTLNACAVAHAATKHDADVVLIPAGLAGDPHFNAQEDWVAATAIAMVSGAEIVRGVDAYRYWRERIQGEGVPALFASAPHAEKLRMAGLGADIAYCAQMDVTAAVPKAVERTEHGVIVRCTGQT